VLSRRPIRRNSVLEGLTDRRLEVIQEETLDIVSSRQRILASKLAVEKEMKS
jgi:hypothetical protein